jgi:hypothetical protein
MARPKIYKEGEILSIGLQGMIYNCPPLPALETIRGYELPKEEQVWRRRTDFQQWSWNTEADKGLHWTQTATPEQWAWYDEEILRLNKGEWIYINGIPIYFNKYAYFFHQWFMLLHMEYPIFKDTSLEYLRFFELCEKDRFTFGDCGIKGRRVGLSSMSASIKVLISILEKNTISGIISKTGIDAQEMYFMCKNGIENLPPFLMPDINKVTDSEIHIAKRTAKNKIASDKGLNNRINWLDTSEKAYDGRAMRHITVDEAGKWSPANVKSFLSKVSDTLIKGTVMVGKVSLFSTVEKGDKGGENFREIWDGSNHIDGKVDKYGRTKTRLKRFFIPAYKGYLGYIGRYGESIVENPTKQQIDWLKTYEYYNPLSGEMEKCPDPLVGAKDWLQTGRDMLADDPESLAEEKRKNPFEWKEVFEGANNRCNFNLDELNNQIERIEAKLEGTGKKENGRRVRFIGPNEFVDDSKGIWYILKLPKHVNKHYSKGGIKCPDNCDYGAAGMDTYANARSTVEKGSDACVIVHSRYDALDPENSDEPVAMLLGRPSTKLDFHNQVFWGMQYYGIQLLAERAPTDWEDYAIHNNLASPLDAVKLNGYLATTRRYNDSEVYGISPQDKQAREQHLTEMKEYANNKIHKIKFLTLLRNMIHFNIDDRTDYDACMAWGYSLMCLKAYVKKDIKPAGKKLTILKVFKKSA